MKQRLTSHNGEQTVALIYGGKSCEHEISVITACLAKGYFGDKLVSVYLDKNNRAFVVGNDWTPHRHLTEKPKNRAVFLTGESAIAIVRGGRLVTVHVDVAVNCCHGLNGEDGCVAALCQMAGIPLVGSDVASSAVAMDKVLTKRMLDSFGFATVKGKEISKRDAALATDALSQLRYPLIVKPTLLGSSIGVKLAHSPDELDDALNNAFRYCPRVLVEEALTDFTELNCAAIRVHGEVVVSNVDEPTTVHELLTFSDKYISNTAKKKPPVSSDTESDVRRITAEIYQKLNFGGVIRVDFLYDNTTGKLYVNEINTTPGSLAFGLWEGRFSRTAYGEALVSEAVADYRDLQSFTYTFSSGVLNGGNGIKKK